MNAAYFSTGNGFVKCGLCPHACILNEGETGSCGVRKNVDNRIELPFFGRLSSISIDPMEKKPLYHFYPGSKIFSIGFLGCNLRCQFCQNHSISQSFEHETRYFSPREIVDAVEESGEKFIAFTYSEPVVHFEYVYETAKTARNRKIKTVLVTNGMLNKTPAEELLSVIDAANVDLKCFDRDFYRKELKGELQTVLDFIEVAHRLCHIEVTTLVIPGKNDSVEEIDALSRHLARIDSSIPYHLSCYYPRYRYTIRPTSFDDIEPLMNVAQRHLAYVYAGNTDRGNETKCPKCGTLLIRRRGFSSVVQGLTDGKCTKCGTPIPVRCDGKFS